VLRKKLLVEANSPITFPTKKKIYRNLKRFRKRENENLLKKYCVIGAIPEMGDCYRKVVEVGNHIKKHRKDTGGMMYICQD